MNTKILDRYYEKLNPRERLAAMIAALGRKDWNEYHKLGRSAPKGKMIQVRDTHGLLEAFELAAMFHMILQLGNLATFYFLMSLEDDQKVNVKEYDTDDAIDKCLQNIIENGEAWREICKEYNLDPIDALATLPFREFARISETIANLSIALENKGMEPDIESATNTYREMIEKTRAQWE